MPSRSHGRPTRQIHHIESERCHTCHQAPHREYAAIEEIIPAVGKPYGLVYHFCSRRHRDTYVGFRARQVKVYHGRHG